MRKRSPKQSAVRRHNRVLLIAAVAVLVAATAITVISRQRAAGKTIANPKENKTGATVKPNYITRRIGGQDIQVDPQTGDIKPLTPEEAKKLADGLAPMLDDSADGLVQVHHADGSVSMDLQGRFQNVAVARINADGTIEQSCVDNKRDAAKFFGIDRKLIENAPTARKPVNGN